MEYHFYINKSFLAGENGLWGQPPILFYFKNRIYIFYKYYISKIRVDPPKKKQLINPIVHKKKVVQNGSIKKKMFATKTDSLFYIYLNNDRIVYLPF